MYQEGFQWDENKNELNREKHGIDFSDASKIFEKPTLDAFDDRKAYGEVRYNSIGQMDDGTCINVTHTERDGDIRIISARCADKNEREQYKEAIREYNLERQITIEGAPTVPESTKTDLEPVQRIEPTPAVEAEQTTAQDEATARVERVRKMLEEQEKQRQQSQDKGMER